MIFQYVKNKQQSLQSALNLAKIGFVAIMAFSLSGCFLFDDGTKEGFTINGVFDGDDNTVLPTCDVNALNNRLFIMRNEGVSFRDNPESGALVMSMAGQCFARNTESGWNRFDFVSPELNDWDDATGFVYHVNTNLTGLYVQSLLKVKKPNGDIVYKLDTGTEPAFIPLSQLYIWRKVDFVRPPIEPGEEVLAVHIRVFVPDTAFTGPEALIKIDQVVKTE